MARLKSTKSKKAVVTTAIGLTGAAAAGLFASQKEEAHAASWDADAGTSWGSAYVNNLSGVDSSAKDTGGTTASSTNTFDPSTLFNQTSGSTSTAPVVPASNAASAAPTSSAPATSQAKSSDVVSQVTSAVNNLVNGNESASTATSAEGGSAESSALPSSGASSANSQQTQSGQTSPATSQAASNAGSGSSASQPAQSESNASNGSESSNAGVPSNSNGSTNNSGSTSTSDQTTHQPQTTVKVVNVDQSGQTISPDSSYTLISSSKSSVTDASGNVTQTTTNVYQNVSQSDATPAPTKTSLAMNVITKRGALDQAVSTYNKTRTSDNAQAVLAARIALNKAIADYKNF